MSVSRPAYLPDNWDNDMEMSGLMSYLKAKHVNPSNYDRVVGFWKKLISDYCRHQKTCLFTPEELKQKFKRGSQLPSPLPTVISEMQCSGQLMTRVEFEKQNQGWLQWGASLISPSSWLQGIVGGFDNNSSNTANQLVHIPVLKEQARELLLFYRNNYEMLIDCPDVVDYNELRDQAAHIVDTDSFSLVISELVRMGEVSVGHSKDGDKVLKFKDQKSQGPARFTETDANVHDLRRTMTRLDADIKRAEQKEQLLKEEAKTALGRKDKKGALNIMRKVARVRKEIQDKDIQYQRLLSILEQLASSKQTKEIIEVYKAGSAAFKETLERQGLTPEKVDMTMDSVLETMQDYRDVEEALREGFRSLPAGDSVEEAELESELNELIREAAAEEEEKKREADIGQPIAESGNRVRVGKRTLDLSDLPEVPAGMPMGLGDFVGPSTSSASSRAAMENGNGASLEERWKRLRTQMHAS